MRRLITPVDAISAEGTPDPVPLGYLTLHEAVELILRRRHKKFSDKWRVRGATRTNTPFSASSIEYGDSAARSRNALPPRSREVTWKPLLAIPARGRDSEYLRRGGRGHFSRRAHLLTRRFAHHHCRPSVRTEGAHYSYRERISSAGCAPAPLVPQGLTRPPGPSVSLIARNPAGRRNSHGTNAMRQ